MAINGPKFGSSAPDPSSVPPKPKSASRLGENKAGKNLALAAGGGILLFIVLAVMNSNTTSTTAPSSTPANTEQTAANAPRYGVYAVDTAENGRGWGLGYDAPTEEEAKKVAMEQCQKAEGAQCKLMSVFTAGYTAIAEGSTSWGTSGAEFSAQDARNEAVAACRDGAQDPDSCKVIYETKF